MSALGRILDLLPAPYTAAPDSVLAQLLNAFALEIDVLQEDVDRLRQTHWVETIYRLEDLEKLAALVGVGRLPWETLATFRARLLPLVAARLDGAVTPGHVKAFVRDYLLRAEQATGATFVPGLRSLGPDEAYDPPPDRPRFRPLRLVEHPPRRRRSSPLLQVGGRVPYLFRWTERNAGLDETTAALAVTGLSGGRTSVPIVVNLTTGDLIGYADRLAVGRTVLIEPAGGGGDPRAARATIDGADVTPKLFSLGDVRLGVPFEREAHDPTPRLPRLARGDNDWIFLAVGLYDVRGLDRFFLALADAALREGVFDATFFDDAIFPSGPVAKLEMAWTEVEPASFEVHVPRHLVVEPADGAAGGDRPHRQVGDALAGGVQEIRAGGVRAAVRFAPFVEVQPQRVRARVPWLVLDPERGSPGERDGVSVGARFGESGLGAGRLE